MSAISRLPTRPIGHHYLTNTFSSNDWSLFRSFDGRYIIPPNILPKDISFKTGIDPSWIQMFARHLPFLNPAYSNRMNMGLHVDAEAKVDDEDWQSTLITWIKTFFGKQFQTYIYDCYVKYIIQQVKNTVTLPNFDPNTINNLQDVLNFIQGRLMLDLFRQDRNKCFNVLFMLYRRIGQSDNQGVTEEAIISYFHSNGIENIMLGEITIDKTQGCLRKHSLVTLAIAVNNRLLTTFKECERKAFGCHLIMDRKVTNENSMIMGDVRYEIVTIDRTLAPRDRYDRTAGGALYYLKYDGKTTDGRLTATSFFGITNCDIDHIIPKLVSAAVNAGITLDKLIDMVSHEFTNGKCNVCLFGQILFSHIIVLFMNINSNGWTRLLP